MTESTVTVNIRHCKTPNSDRKYRDSKDTPLQDA